MQNIKNRMFTLPNAITLANLACGCAATVSALSGGGGGNATESNLAAAFWLIVAAAIFDFADGFVARITGQYSALGVELDSLADTVSFGVAPSAILFSMYGGSVSILEGHEALSNMLGWVVFAVAIFSALRLARFNVDDSQSEEFSGLPTPASAIAIASLGMMFHSGEMAIPREVLLVIAAALSCLLICSIRMFSLKFKDFSWQSNRLRYVFLAASLVLVATLGIGGVVLAITLYVAVSSVRHFYLLNRKKS